MRIKIKVILQLLWILIIYLSVTSVIPLSLWASGDINGDKKAAKELYTGLLKANKEIKRLHRVNYSLKIRYRQLLSEAINSKKEIIALRKQLDTSFNKTKLWINQYKKLKAKKVNHKWIGISMKFGLSHSFLRTEAELWISPFKAMRGFNFFISAGYEYYYLQGQFYRSTGNFYWLAGIGYRFS